MKYLITCIFYLYFNYLGSCQAYTITDVNSLSDLFSFEKSKNLTDSYPYIEGSPYLNEEFSKGEIIINDSVIIKNVLLRYNIYSDRMQFMNDQNQVLEIGPSAREISYYVGKSKFITIDYSDNGVNQSGILELLADGNVKLYKKYSVDFKEATKAIGYQDPKPNRFEPRQEEYLAAIGKEGKPETFRNSKKLLEKLKQFYPDVDQYVKKKKLKLRKEEELIQLIKYCNK